MYFPKSYESQTQVALTVPVGSATREQSFSSTRRLKNCLRSSCVTAPLCEFECHKYYRTNLANGIVPEELLNAFAYVDGKLCLAFENVIR